MSYDFRKTAEQYQWWVQDNRPKRVMFGPYPSPLDAEIAQVLTLDFDKIQASVSAKGRWDRIDRAAYSGPVAYAVGSASADDIESLKSDPESNGYRSVTFKKPTALKMHASWKKRPYGVDPEDAARYLLTGDSKFIFP